MAWERRREKWEEKIIVPGKPPSNFRSQRRCFWMVTDSLEEVIGVAW